MLTLLVVLAMGYVTLVFFGGITLVFFGGIAYHSIRAKHGRRRRAP
jgi:hypothetical protein